MIGRIISGRDDKDEWALRMAAFGTRLSTLPDNLSNDERALLKQEMQELKLLADAYFGEAMPTGSKEQKHAAK